MKRFWHQNQVYVSCFVIVLLFNVALFLALSKNGIGLSIDSVNYFSAAQGLWANFNLVLFDGLPLVNAVPLYSFLLLPAYALGIDVGSFALFLHVLFFNVQALFIYFLLRQLISDKLILWAYLALMLGNYFAFVQVYVWALTEMGFMALLSAWVYCQLYRSHATFWCAILFGLLCMQRYVVWFFLPAILVYWFSQKKSFFYVAKQLWLGVLITGIWVFRNYQLHGNFSGEHQLLQKFALASFTENLNNLVWGILDLNPLFAGVAYYLFALLVIGLAWLKADGNGKVMLTLLFWMGLSLFIGLMAQRNIQMSQLPRYISVFYVLISFGFWLFFEQMSLSIYLKRTALIAFAGISLFLLINKALYFKQVGLGTKASRAYWVEIDNVALSNYSDLPMLSNFPDVVWLKTGKTCGYTKYSAEDYDVFAKRNVPGQYRVIWFKDSSREMLMDEDFLNNNADFTPMYDGHWHKIGTLKIGSAY